MTECYIGLMSGTSMDAIDAVLVDCSGPKPLLLHHHSIPLPAEIRHQLQVPSAGLAVTLEQLTTLDVTLGELFAQTALGLLQKANIPAARVRAIGSHGQTVFHHPQGKTPGSLQIGDPNIIAEHTAITTVADFRRRDIAAGGQGAPLVPAFHKAVFHDPQENRVILNIGGIANITVLPAGSADEVRGFDTGPGNTLMDAWAEQRLGKPLDTDGQWAQSGAVIPELLKILLADPYFSLVPPKSTGKEYFHLDWAKHALMQLNAKPAAENIQATLCELTAASIALAIERHAPQTRRMLVCGGGAYNTFLLQRLKNLLKNQSVETTADHGIAPQWVEAMAFAWLAKQTMEGRPGNLPAVTGAKRAVVLGGIYKAF